MGLKAPQNRGSDNMYPDPDISVDKAWGKMNTLLRSERQINRRERLSIVGIIVLIVSIAIIQFNNTENKNIAVAYSNQKLDHSNNVLNLRKLNNIQEVIKDNIPLLSHFKKHRNIKHPNQYEITQRRFSDSRIIPINWGENNIENLDFKDKNKFSFYQDSLYDKSCKTSLIGVDQLKLKNKKLAKELHKINFYAQIAIPFQKPVATHSGVNFVTSFGIEKSIGKSTNFSFLVGINERCLSNGNEILNHVIIRDSLGAGRPPIYQKVHIINTNGYSIACVAKQSIGKLSLGIGFKIVNNYSAFLSKSDSSSGRISDSSYSINKKDYDWRYITAHDFQFLSQLSYTYKKLNLGVGVSLPLNSISKIDKDDRLLSSNIFLRYNFN